MIGEKKVWPGFKRITFCFTVLSLSLRLYDRDAEQYVRWFGTGYIIGPMHR